MIGTVGGDLLEIGREGEGESEGDAGADVLLSAGLQELREAHRSLGELFR